MRKTYKKMIFALVILLSIGTVVFSFQKHQESKIDNELNNRYYINLEQYYPHEKLDEAFVELTNKLEDETFVNQYFDSNIMNDEFDERFVEILGGFLKQKDHNLDKNKYSTLSEFTTKQNENVSVFDLDREGLPIITHYEGLYTDQLIPIICFTYEGSNYRYDLCFIMNQDHQWVFIDLK